MKFNQLFPISAEYKWNGSDWIWTDDSKDDGGGGGSVQDTGGGGAGRSGQGSRKFEGAGRNVSETEKGQEVEETIPIP